MIKRFTTGKGTRTQPQPVMPDIPKVGGLDKIAAFLPVSSAYTFGCCKNVDGCYYFVAMGRINKWRDPYVYKYNPSTNLVEQGHRIQIGVPIWDTHRLPTIDHDDDGNIYVCCEELHVTNLHGSTMRLYKTTVPGDLSTLTLIKTFSGRWSYCHVCVNGSNVFITARGTTSTVSFARGTLYYWNSTDGGQNFGSPVQFYGSGNEQKVAYFRRVHCEDRSQIYLLLNERDNDTVNWTFVSLMKGTFNSNVWTNVTGSFSKNVSSSGATTRAEHVANALVLETTDYNDQAIQFRGGHVKSDGTVKLLLTVEEKTGNETSPGNPEVLFEELRFYIHNGTSWSYNNADLLDESELGWGPIMRYVDSHEEFDDIIYVDPVTRDVSLRRSYDNFATEISIPLVEGNGRNFMFGTHAFNAVTEDDYLFIMRDSVGAIRVSDVEKPLDYTDLYLLRV